MLGVESAALSMLQDRPLLLGSIGAGLVCYAGYQWVNARCRIIDT